MLLFAGCAMADVLSLEGRPRLALEDGRYKGFYEMHIEQGTQLEGAGLRLGIVTGIVAIWQWRITVEGQPGPRGRNNHGGAARRRPRRRPPARRRWMPSFRVLCGERTTWTTGRIALDPGAPSIIPGRADMLFQFRDLSLDVLTRLEAGFARFAAARRSGASKCTVHAGERCSRRSPRPAMPR